MSNPPRKRNITTLQLKPETRVALKKKKRGDESYDDLIRRGFKIR